MGFTLILLPVSTIFLQFINNAVYDSLRSLYARLIAYDLSTIVYEYSTIVYECLRYLYDCLGVYNLFTFSMNPSRLSTIHIGLSLIVYEFSTIANEFCTSVYDSYTIVYDSSTIVCHSSRKSEQSVYTRFSAGDTNYVERRIV